MKFSVACNFEDALIEGLAKYPVYEIYGKLTSDFFGGGRPSFYLPEVDRPALERYVRKTHEHGVRFNYLLNALAMGNTEFTREGQHQMNELLEWLDGHVNTGIASLEPTWLRTTPHPPEINAQPQPAMSPSKACSPFCVIK